MRTEKAEKQRIAIQRNRERLSGVAAMELSQLETFLAVAEERSFSRAALRLHRTQPAVSQVIRKLERRWAKRFLTARRATVR